MKPIAAPLLLLAFLSAAPAAAETVRRCAVASVDGPSAAIWRGGRPAPARVGQPVVAGMRIVTGPRTRVALACDDGMRVAVAGGTEIDLGMLTGAAPSEGYAARLLRGLAGFVLPLVGARRFEVRTPSAVAAVRSTEWLVAVEDDATAVFVREGAVAVLAAEGGGVLGPGEGIDVTASGVAGPVKTWGAARRAALAARLGDGWE